MDASDQFGINLRRVRVARGWSQARLADAVGMDVTAISRVERGARNPRLTTIARIAEALAVRPDQLLAPTPGAGGPDRAPRAPGPSMFIARLIVNAKAERKLGARTIRPAEARGVVANGPYVTRNPHPRVRASRLLIGRTDGGRMITLVVQRDTTDDATWHVMTGWPSSRREIAAYRSAS